MWNVSCSNNEPLYGDFFLNVVGGNKQHHFHRHEILLPNKITRRPKAMLTSLWNIYVKNRFIWSARYCCMNIIVFTTFSLKWKVHFHEFTNGQTWEKMIGNDNNNYYCYNLHFSFSTEMFTFGITLKFSEISSLWPDPFD